MSDINILTKIVPMSLITTLFASLLITENRKYPEVFVNNETIV